MKTILSWNSSKNQTFRNAKYTPIFFPFAINNQTFIIFQTLEMIDFKASLSEVNINQLIKEKGIFIAHTYFSAPMPYQKGRLLINDTEINPIVINELNLLSKAIEEHQIWNPTLKELVEYLNKYYIIKFDIDENQSIIINSEIEQGRQFIS